MFRTPVILLKGGNVRLHGPISGAKKTKKMRLRFALSSAGCVVLSLLLVGAAAQDSESRQLARSPR